MEKPRTPVYLEVIRTSPPEITRCRGRRCGARIEWVVTAKGRRMPVTHPLTVIRKTPVVGSATVWITIDAAQSHFATCPDAAGFKKHQRR